MDLTAEKFNRENNCGTTNRLQGKILFICATCSKVFKTRKEFVIHERVHTNERPYKCRECDKAFKQSGALRDHMLTHSGIRNHVCQVCDGKFSTPSSLKRHIKKVHEKDKSFACPLCSEVFLNKSSYVEHKNKHFTNVLKASTSEIYRQASAKDGYECSACNKHFKKMSSLYAHLDVHSEQTYPCKYCDETYTFLALKMHVKRQHKLQVCPMCSEHYFDRKLYNVHFSGHFKVTGETCNYCKRVFGENELGEHMKVAHAGQGETHQCDVCVKVFHSAQHLQKHLNFAHVECKECGKYMSYDAMSQHYIENHLKDRVYKCPRCKAVFKSKSRLCFHLNWVHLIIGKFPCRVCGKKFRRYKNLQIHERKVGHKAKTKALKSKTRSSTSKMKLSNKMKSAMGKTKIKRPSKKKAALKVEVKSEVIEIKTEEVKSEDFDSVQVKSEINDVMEREQPPLEDFKCKICKELLDFASPFASEALLKEHIIFKHLVANDSPPSKGSDPSEGSDASKGWDESEGSDPSKGSNPSNGSDLLRNETDQNSKDKHYKCPLCWRTYSICSNLAQHIIVEHCSPYVPKCKLCRQEFKNTKNLYRHNLSTHNSYSCIKCFEMFSTKAAFMEHKKIHITKKGSKVS